MEVQPGLGTSGKEVRARGTAVKSPEKGLCLHWPMTQLAHLSLEQEVNTASYLELPKPIPGKPWWFSSKESTCNAGDVRDRGSISGSGRSPGGGNGNLLQYSCLEKSHGQKSLAGYSPQGRKESDVETKHQHQRPSSQ